LETQAQSGNVAAMELLADTYLNGTAEAPNPQKAFLWFERAALQGSTLAQLTLAQMYYEGEGVAADKTKASRMMQDVLRKAGEDNAVLLLSLGRAYKTGTGLPKDSEQALKWFMRAAKLGHPGAKLEVARIIEWQPYENYKPEDAVILLQEAEAELVGDASMELGKMYAAGHLVPMDGAKALEKYLNAHRLGSLEGTRLAGFYYLSGFGGVKDTAKGMALLEEAASQGSGDAMMNIANHYQYGDAKDYKKYLSWLDKAAKADQAEAMYLIADMYKEGKNGYPKDEKKAIELLKYAAGPLEFSLAQSELKSMGVKAKH
jgi:TPR repeat protein